MKVFWLSLGVLAVLWPTSNAQNGTVVTSVPSSEVPTSLPVVTSEPVSTITPPVPSSSTITPTTSTPEPSSTESPTNPPPAPTQSTKTPTPSSDAPTHSSIAPSPSTIAPNPSTKGPSPSPVTDSPATEAPVATDSSSTNLPKTIAPSTEEPGNIPESTTSEPVTSSIVRSTTEAPETIVPVDTSIEVPAVSTATAPKAASPATTIPVSEVVSKSSPNSSSLPLILGIAGGAVSCVLIAACFVYHRAYSQRDSSEDPKTPPGEIRYHGLSPSMHHTHNSSLNNPTFLNPSFVKRASSVNKTPVHALNSPSRAVTNQALWDVLLGRDTITSDPSPNVISRFANGSQSSSIDVGTSYSESHVGGGSSFDSSRAPSSIAVSECSDIYPSSGSLFRVSSGLRSTTSSDVIEMEL
ncbi:hypothetical protein THRCLA_02723 [Thraustotheca clavata]|uniref:Secreted protein n=1 Tax=Thraustotheca clavata TaxID=74557 RepID=A0A1W0A491_9STRA|nr:hypothetical protein THRCLA_02723 [Thraustotheca clavata]